MRTSVPSCREDGKASFARLCKQDDYVAGECFGRITQAAVWREMRGNEKEGPICFRIQMRRKMVGWLAVVLGVEKIEPVR